jgi:hypothetical protein
MTVRKIAVALLTIMAAACASTGPVDLEQFRRVVGTENDVRIDAQIYGEALSASVVIPVRYDITNNRQSTIAVADMVSETSWDADAQTITVTIGSEVPGATLLPRLISIAPGEKKSFATSAHVNVLIAADSLNRRPPNAMRLKLNFLGDTEPFAQLVNLTQKGLYDPKLADELFPKWLERNETVYTNTLPMRWTVTPVEQTPASRRGRG